MSLAAILGGLASFATIAGAVVWLAKRADWSLSKSPEQKDQDIEKQNQDAKHEAEETGRPV